MWLYGSMYLVNTTHMLYVRYWSDLKRKYNKIKTSAGSKPILNQEWKRAETCETEMSTNEKSKKKQSNIWAFDSKQKKQQLL